MTDIGPQKGPSSKGRILAQMKFVILESDPDYALLCDLDKLKVSGVDKEVIDKAIARIQELKKDIKQIHKDYGCEVRDPCGTIWQYCQTLLAEIQELKRSMQKLQET